MNSRNLLAGTSIVLIAIAIPALGQQSTETYTYDALGRLISVETAGGQNNNETHSICYDDAGNRTQYKSDGSGTPVSCSGGGAPPPPPPPPPPSTITITDSSLNVLPAHTSTYSCFSGNLFGTPYATCTVLPSNVLVYNTFNTPPLDPGYSLSGSGALEVTSAAYGTGVAP